MTTAIRVDGSADIGAGHVMRCLTVAAECKARGQEALFLSRVLPPILRKRVTEMGFEMVMLDSAATDGTAVAETSEEPIDESRDAIAFMNAIPHATSVVVVDHYRLSHRWEEQVRHAGLRVLAIDDLVRDHSADLVVDQTLGRSAESYYQAGNVATALAGTEYALVRPEFRRARLASAQDGGSGHRLLIGMGGGRTGEITRRILSILRRWRLPWLDSVDVLGSVDPEVSAPEAAGEERLPIRALGFVDDVAALMSRCTLAIGGAGSSTWERMVVGLPSVVVPIADNQRDVAAALAEHEVAVVLSPEELDDRLLPALHHLREGWHDYVRKNQELCDGLGVRRLAQHLYPRTARDGAPVTLRKATGADIERVYQWQLEPGIRRFARNPEPPEWHSHVRWMRERLAQPDDYFYIIVHGEADVGILRLDRKCAEADVLEVSIFVSPDHGGLGIGTHSLRIAAEIHRENPVYAFVKEANRASQKLFEKAGYDRISETEFYLPTREAP